MQHHHLTASEWDAIANDPQFVALLKARRRFVIPATIFFLLFYLGLPVGVAFAPETMNQPVLESLTLANLYGFAQFVMAWVLLGLYMREARSFDDRAKALVDRLTAELVK